jgi:uncharacterized damage-inducible protein DinB
MKQFSSIQLLEGLQADTREIMLATTRLAQQDPELLMRQPGEGRWSVAQVIAHLNSYGRYYLPAIEAAINKNRYQKNDWFKPGWIGNYFTKMMLPGKNGQITNKMQSPKDHRPSADVHSKAVIDEFTLQQQWLLQLLERAKDTDIGRVRVPVSISKLIKLKLGDTFRFLIAHEQRHFVQVARTMREIGVENIVMQ